MLLLVAAQVAMSTADGESTSLAPPVEVALALAALFADGSLLRATVQTLLATLGGLALGGVVGLCAGIFLGLFRIADRLMDFTLEVLRPVPPVALIPLMLMIFGTGYRLEIFIIAFGSVWPVLILTRSAIANIEPRLMEVAALLRLRPIDRIYKIVVPAIAPQLFVAFRLAAAISLVLAVTVEITLNPLGLGSGIMLAASALNPAQMLAYLVWIALVGFGMNALLLALQRRFFAYGTHFGVLS
jgi:NitT/TauT family transport system permease protein